MITLTSHHTADYPTPVTLSCRTSRISSLQVPEQIHHQEERSKADCSHHGGTALRPRPQEFKVHHIDGAGLQSPFIGAENRTVPFIGRDFHHQQCSSPGTPRGKEQENRPPPPQQRTGYPPHINQAASPIPKPGNYLTSMHTARNDCCRTNRVVRAGIGRDYRKPEDALAIEMKSRLEGRGGIENQTYINFSEKMMET